MDDPHMPSDPPGWMSGSPEAAAILAGLLATILRAATAGGPRSIRDALIDACGTLPIAYAAFHGAIGLGWSPDLAIAAAVFSGAVGWAVVQRVLLRWVERLTG